MELTAQVPGLTGIDARGRGHGRVRTVESQPQRPSTRDLWNRHGSSAYALACGLLGNEAAAAEAVLLAIADLARWDVVADGEARRRMAQTIYRHTQEPAGAASESSGADRLPPAMVWLSRLARLQRESLALCVYGGLTHREVATLLDVPPDTVAELITAGLRELRRVADEGAASCA
jgi:DNA-directed RNA polymerase specialized sigma24 family protein